MTLTPADVLTWTAMPVSQTQLDAFEPAAIAKLNADGGYAITGSSRTQLLSYIIAGYLTTVAGAVGKQSESIGNYSYTRQASGTSIWVDLYKETLASLVASAGSGSGTGLVDRVDKDIMKLNRQFPRPAGRLI